MTPIFTKPATPKELAYYLDGRSVQWVRAQCKAGTIKTLPVGVPYLIHNGEWKRGYDPGAPFSAAFAEQLLGLD